MFYDIFDSITLNLPELLFRFISFFALFNDELMLFTDYSKVVSYNNFNFIEKIKTDIKMNNNKQMHRREHHHREDLIGEHTFGDAGQLVLLIIFLGIWITDSFFLHATTGLQQYVPVVLRIILAASVFIFSFIISRKGLRIIFGEIRQKPEVVTKGIFSKVRHPIYLGAMLLYLGFIFITLSLASLSIWAVIIVFYNYIARYEERLLLLELGEDYAKYMEEVPRWGIF